MTVFLFFLRFVMCYTSTRLVQLLRDNWTLWTSDPSGEHEETGAEAEDDTGVGMSRRHQTKEK